MLPGRRQADLRQGRRMEERGLFPPLESYSGTPPLRSHQVPMKEWGGRGPPSSDPVEWECCVWRGVQGRLSLQQRGSDTSGLGPPGSRVAVVPRNGLCGAGTPGYLESPNLRAAVQSSDLEAARRGRTGEAEECDRSSFTPRSASVSLPGKGEPCRFHSLSWPGHGD